MSSNVPPTHQESPTSSEVHYKQTREEEARNRYSDIVFGQRRYRTGSNVLGTGSFGSVMMCHAVGDDSIRAVKIVSMKSKKHSRPASILEKEVKVYTRMAKHAELRPYLIRLYSLITLKDNKGDLCHGLVMEYAGKDLDKILTNRGEYTFSRYQLFKIGRHLLPGLRALHEAGFVHRDIKPENIAMKISRRQNIFQVKMIDYGLSCVYNPNKKPPRMNRGVGTPRFCAWQQQFGYPGSPARDIESLMYTMCYMSGTQLPWHGLGISNPKRKTRTIAYLKRDADTEKLCEYMDDFQNTRTTQGAKLLAEIRVLKYDEMPPYDKLLVYFKSAESVPTDFDSLSSNISCPPPSTKKKRPKSQVGRVVVSPPPSMRVRM